MTRYRSLVRGGYFSSDPRDRSLPVSIRTNNPGAINTASWVRTYPGFVNARVTTPGNSTAIFEAPEYGVGLWWELLHRYRGDIGATRFSLRNVIFKYCGRGREREAVDYLQFVSARTNMHGDQLIDIHDFAALLVLAKAFFHYEAGRSSPLKEAQITYGFEFGAHQASEDATPSVPSGRVSRRSTKSAGMSAISAAPAMSSSRRVVLAELAESEAQKKLRWTNASSEAEKYLKPLRAPMRRLGQIGARPVFYNWCAAFVTWCARKAQYAIPDQPVGWNATMALVESWKYWAKQQGTYRATPAVSEMEPGDVLLYEWFDGDRTLDHIGIFLRSAGRSAVWAAEGNAHNRSGVMKRTKANIAGVVRLPD